MSSDSLNYNEV